VFFARSSNFKGGFVITSSGKPGKPIVFTAYGNGPTPIFTNPNYDNLNGNAIQSKCKSENWVIAYKVCDN